MQLDVAVMLSRQNKGLDPSFLPLVVAAFGIDISDSDSDFGDQVGHGHGAETCPSRVIISRWVPGFIAFMFLIVNK